MGDWFDMNPAERPLEVVAETQARLAQERFFSVAATLVGITALVLLAVAVPLVILAWRAL
jgi:hypothetical protein